MKTRFLCFLPLSLSLFSAEPADLALPNGQVLQRARIVAIGETVATIVYSGGAISVPIEQVPPERLAHAKTALQDKDPDRKREIQEITAREAARVARQERTRIEEGPRPPAAEDRVAGRAPSEGWFVPFVAVDKWLKPRLRDPDSLQYIETDGPFFVRLKDGPAWEVHIAYRAKNGFGGYTSGNGIAWLRHDRVIAWRDIEQARPFTPVTDPLSRIGLSMTKKKVSR